MATSLVTQTLPPAPGGMNQAFPAQEIDDTQAQYIQDGLVDYPGLLRRRGKVRKVTGIATLPSRKATGIVMTLDPLGVDKYGVLTGDASNGFFTALSDDLASTVDIAWPHALPGNPAAGPSSSYRIVDSKAALGGGAFVGVSSAYDANSPNQGLALWHGANKANVAKTITVARGSAAVTGSGFSGFVVPGMFVFSNTNEGYTATLIGVVRSVSSDTALSLIQVSPYAVTAISATFQSLRGVYPKVNRGQITVATDSAIVNGGGTKFRGQGLDTGTWNLYRASDLEFVGKVTSVQTDISLTLTANAAIAMADEAYVALRADGDWSISSTGNADKPGFLGAVYAEHQWFANNGAQYEKTYRLWFADPSDPEALDVTEDGDWIPIGSTEGAIRPIEAVMPSQNALVVLKEDEAYAVFGTGRTTFTPRKIWDDGTLGGMSVQAYGGGVIWAGREGVHFFDGIQVTNMTAETLGDVWKNSIRTFDPSQYRMWSMIARNHYKLFIENLAPTIAVKKGHVSAAPTKWVVSINLVTGAVTLHTNIHLRGAVELPASSGHAVWYLVNDSTKGVICDAAALFDDEGVDEFGADGGTAGPDFFFESKKFSGGDDLRLKRYKLLLIHYLAQGGVVKVDTVTGLNDVGSTLVTTFPATVQTWTQIAALLTTWNVLKDEYATWDDIIQGVFRPKRAKFRRKSTHLSFRLYQSSAAITRLRLGPFQLGYKFMRPGRVSSS